MFSVEGECLVWFDYLNRLSQYRVCQFHQNLNIVLLLMDIN